MVENLTLVQLASAMSRHAALRHSVIAENVANADTPGYRARAVEDFSALVKEGFTLRATRPGHFGGSADGPAARAEIREAAIPAGPNGNSVNLEEEVRRAVQVQGQHALAMAVYSKTLDILRLGLGPNR